jgi:hypothetical protein
MEMDYIDCHCRLEREHRELDEQRRRDAARASTKYFEVNGIRIKHALYITTEKEDLTLFAEDFPTEVDDSEDDENRKGDGQEEKGGEGLEVNEALFGGDEEEDLDDL